MGTSAFGSTAGFLPYLNFARGIRIDHPADWTVQEQSSPISFAVQFGSPQESPADVFQENLVLQVQPVFADVTQAAFVQAWQAIAQQARLQVLEAGDTTLAGIPAFRAVFQTQFAAQTPLQGQVLLFLFVSGGKGYSAVYNAQQGHFDTFLPTVLSMLSTLQVTSF